VMEIGVRISESQATLDKDLVASVLFEPEVRQTPYPIPWRTSGSGH
jgi:hypothetical protein